MQRLGRALSLLAVATATALLAGCVLQTQPHAEFTATPESGFPPLVVTFNGTASSSPNGVIVEYEWLFGDGESAGGASVTHTYVAKGIYDVTLEVRDEAGKTDARTRSVQALNRAPIARFSLNVYTTPVRQPVWFNASESSDADGEIMQYIWSFGDGETAEGEVVEHEYQTANGTGWRPEITLTVVDDDGASNSVVWRSLIVVGCDSCGG
jgi:PKD repeat protein